ncbi:MAG: type II toxin-antitoxin system ParD family antitoxin [Alphaproteobacteria bacterium]
MPTRNINLTDHFDAFIEGSIADGRYQNASEVVRDALRLLEQRREEEVLRLLRLKSAAAAGFDAVDRGEFEELDEPALRTLLADMGRSRRSA